MRTRIVSAVALYGPKDERIGDFFAGIQSVIAEHAGAGFRPYSLDQIHATLIMLTGVPDQATGTIVNECLLEQAGIARQMDLRRAMRILAAHLAHPLRVRIGGYRRDDHVPFLSRGQHLFERAFSVQQDADVVVGWPAAALAGTGRPLDRLRRDMNAANVFHKYHHGDADVDDDFHLVVGHHDGVAPDALARAVRAVRARLAADPIELDVGIGDIKIVASDSPTLVPARFVGSVPVGETCLHALMS